MYPSLTLETNYVLLPATARRTLKQLLKEDYYSFIQNDIFDVLASSFPDLPKRIVHSYTLRDKMSTYDICGAFATPIRTPIFFPYIHGLVQNTIEYPHAATALNMQEGMQNIFVSSNKNGGLCNITVARHGTRWALTYRDNICIIKSNFRYPKGSRLFM